MNNECLQHKEIAILREDKKQMNELQNEIEKLRQSEAQTKAAAQKVSARIKIIYTIYSASLRLIYTERTRKRIISLILVAVQCEP